MAATRIQIVIDCHDPDVLVPFWAEALGYVSDPPPDGAESWREHWLAMGLPDSDDLGGEHIAAVDPDGVGPRLWFQPVPEAKAVKNRLHLDLAVVADRKAPVEVRRAEVRAEADRLVALGATLVRDLEEPGVDHVALTLTDPEGNEFCLH